MKADLILVSDLHLRPDAPPCRTDDFHEAIWRKLDFLVDLKKEHGCPIICAGDIFHKAKNPEWYVNLLIEYMSRNLHFYFVAGQHDLPGHRLSNLHDSSLGTLVCANLVTLLGEKNPWSIKGWRIYGASWNQPFPKPKKGKNILVTHRLAYAGRAPFPGVEASSRATAIMKQAKNYQLIVTGDNHIPFTIKTDTQLLVNPGSMSRQTAAQVDHEPRAYLWYAKTNSVEPAYFPIEKGVVSREHIELKEEREKRMTAYVTTLDKEYEVELSFEKNMKTFLATNTVEPFVKGLVQNSMEAS